MISTQAMPIIAAQVNAILEVSSKEVKEKIPKNVITFFKENASKDYYFSYDKTKDLLHQNIRKETQEILAIIYRDYICNDSEKKEFLEKRRKIDYQKELQKKEKYSYEDLFKNRQSDNKIENVQMVEIKESNFISKIILKIKKFIIRGE